MTESRAPLELLERELCTSEPEAIVELVRSMELQLIDSYREKEYAAEGDKPSQYERIAGELYAFYLDRDRMKERYGVGSSEELVELIDSMDAQLAALYEDGAEMQSAAEQDTRATRQATKVTQSVARLHDELGTESAEDVLALVRSMEVPSSASSRSSSASTVSRPAAQPTKSSCVCGSAMGERESGSRPSCARALAARGGFRRSGPARGALPPAHGCA